MSTATIINRLTPDEYLALEQDAEQRHEFLDGELVAMAGGSRRHNLLATRVARLLGNHLEAGPCRVYQSDMKVRVERANRFYYPDVMVCCDPVDEDADDYFETAPALIVEVLSPRTAATDDGEKRVNYQTLPSLAEYLLLDPQTGHAVLYRRGDAFWTRTALVPGDWIELASLSLDMPLATLTGHGET
jgi:Uma2 family endonuclease